MNDLESDIALISGSGDLPLTIFNKLKNEKKTPLLILIQDNAEKILEQFQNEKIYITEFARLLKILKAYKIKKIILAGGIKSRPQLHALHFDLPTLFFLPRLLFALRKGDDALLKAFIKALESYGYQVVAGQEFAPEILAPKQCLLTKHKPTKIDLEDIKLGFKAAKILGQFDIGQAVVSVGGRIIALEGAEGTDNMLNRIKTLREEKKIPLKGGVLVKCSKPQQDLRADLPTIGLETLKKISEVRLSGVAVEADLSIILNQDEMIAYANKEKLFIQTISQEEFESI